MSSDLPSTGLIPGFQPGGAPARTGAATTGSASDESGRESPAFSDMVDADRADRIPSAGKQGGRPGAAGSRTADAETVPSATRGKPDAGQPAGDEDTAVAAAAAPHPADQTARTAPLATGTASGAAAAPAADGATPAPAPMAGTRNGQPVSGGQGAHGSAQGKAAEAGMTKQSAAPKQAGGAAEAGATVKPAAAGSTGSGMTAAPAQAAADPAQTVPPAPGAEGAKAGPQQTAAQTPAGQASAAAATPAQPATPLRETTQPRAILEPRGAAKTGSGGTAAAGAGQGQTGAAGANRPDIQIQPAQPSAEARADIAQSLPRDAQTPLPSAQVPLAGAAAAAADSARTAQMQADLDPALQAEGELQLTRSGDPRAAIDRAGANLPRFTAHGAQQLAGQITRNFNNGQRVFDIRLDPAELGKVDVRLELRADNRVHAVLTAERPETLAELQRSARDLERALADAGLDLSEEGLTFQMSEDGDAPTPEGDGRPGSSLPIFVEGEADGPGLGNTAELTGPLSRYGFLLSRRDSVDMRV